MICNDARLRGVMAERGLDALVATTPENVFYASRFWSPTHWSLRHDVQIYAVWFRGADQRPALVIPTGSLGMAIDAVAAGQEIVPYGPFGIRAADGAMPKEQAWMEPMLQNPRPASPAEALAGLLRSRGLAAGRIGLDERNLTRQQLAAIQTALPGVRLEEAHALHTRVRRLKTPAEVRRLRRAHELIEQGIRRALAAAREGSTEQELARELETAAVEGGGWPLFSIVATGPNGAYPTSCPTNRRLQRGEILRFDVGCCFDRYCSDTARTAVLGPPTAKQADYYAAILEGEQQAIAELGPGVAPRHVFEVAVSAVQRAGIPHYERTHVGHGIGLNLYETLQLGPNDPTSLEPGMVLTVETPYYELGFGGLQVEDTLLITEHGCEYLTALPRELYVLDA